MAKKSVASLQTGSKRLTKAIKLRSQNNPDQIFKGVINSTDKFAFTMCNPPFHQSLEQALAGNRRKWDNLAKANKSAKRDKNITAKLNFSGQNAELWCPGGQRAFVRNMIRESRHYGHQVSWFTCLVSQKENLSPLKLALKKQGVKRSKIVKMAQGQKISRFIAWSFKAQKQS